MKLKSLLFICAISASFLVQAQEAVNSTEDNSAEEPAVAEVSALAPKIEKVEVTGSHIKRIDAEGPSPVLVFDQDDILRSGLNSVSDILRDAGVSSHGSFREVGGQTGAGTSAVDLRGLGQVRTLILLDGQRLPSDAIAGSVDLNMIPMAAVERIEVLKDGASAIYGSDALGGVVNIITKKEFSGHELASTMTLTELEGGERRELSYTSGYNTSRLNLVNIVYLRHNERIEAQDRPWSKDNFSFNGSPGTYSVDNGATMKPDPSCPADLVHSNGSFCLYNFGNEKWEMPYLFQGAVMSKATYEISENLTAVGRLSYTYKETDWVRSPASSSSDFTMGAAPAELGADAGSPVTNIRYRFHELGNRESNTKTNIGSALMGLKGYIGDTWDWQAHLSFNKIDRKERRRGYALKDDIQEAIDNNEFNPFAALGSRGDLSGLLYEPQQNNVSENTFFEAKATGEIGQMSTGPIAMAVGVQGIRELYQDAADDRTLNGEVLNLASSQGGGDRNSYSVFTELNLYLLEKLETSAALRYDHFEGFGDTINPKLAFRYSPWDEVMFRTSVGTGFKAPQMQRLYAAQTTAQIQFVDQVYCDTSGGAACTSQSHSVVEGGNPNLKEETSVSFNFGTLIQPARHHSFGVDFWYYNLENAVEAPNYQALTQQEADGVDIGGYGAVAERDPTTGQLIGRGLQASFLNIGRIETQGLDFSYNGRMKTKWGDFRLRSEHSHMINYKTETLPGTGITNRILLFGRPQWRNNTTLIYSPKKSEEYSLIAKTTGHHSKVKESAGKHPVYTEYDFRYSRSIDSWDGRLTVGINNLFGTVQPFDDSSSLDPDLYYQLYDGRGRALLLSYRQFF